MSHLRGYIISQFKFTNIQIPTIKILIVVSRGHISKYIKKKNVPESQIVEDYDGKKN